MIRRIFSSLFVSVVFAATTVGINQPLLMKKTDQTAMNHWVDSVFRTLSEKERIGQLFMPVITPSLSAYNVKHVQRLIKEVKIGGILFQKGTPHDQAQLTNQTQASARVPLMISLDGEWGLSMRLLGTTRFPKNMMLGAVTDMTLLEAYGQEVARQCHEMGIHVNFAPVLDVNSNPHNPVIGTRSFGENVDEVSRRGLAYARGLESRGILSVAKHYPGHGDTAEDSHYTLPTILHTRERLDSVELAPFRRYIEAGLGGIMTGHLVVPALDPQKGCPASLSKPIITDVLQREMQFSGLCFTDALAMKGARTNKSLNTSVAALLAGNDILLATASPITDFAEIEKALQKGVLTKELINERCKKVLRYKYILGVHQHKSVETKDLNQRLNSSDAAWLAAKLNSEAITLLQNKEETLPLKDLDKKKIAILSIGVSKGNPFQQMINKYDRVEHFSIERTTPAAQVQKVYAALQHFDVILCSIHTVRIPEAAALRQLAKKQTLIYSFFTSPYFAEKYSSITDAKALIMGYEATPLAQEYAAQAIMGGIATKGKLPVSIGKLYPAGSGLSTIKTRLGYHAPQEVGLSASKIRQIDSIAMEGLLNKAYPGCQILVAKDGIVIYEQSFGHLDYGRTQPVSAETVYDLASLSKAVGTLPAVMKAYDERRFTLMTRMGDLMPSLKGSNKATLRVKELLYHQSGVSPVENFYLKAVDKESYKGRLFSSYKTAQHTVRFDSKTYIRTDFKLYPHLVSKTKSAEFPTEAGKGVYIHCSYKDTILQDIRKSPLRRRGAYAYSCVNFMLLKMMLEGLTKQPMDQMLNTTFYDKLGASTLTYNPLRRMSIECIAPTERDNVTRRQVLRGYVHDEAAAFQGGVSGNAGLFSTAGDLAKMLQLYLNDGEYGGHRFLTTETCRLFTRSKSPTNRRGLGFDKPDYKNPRYSPCGRLTPPSTYGHTGYTGTAFWVDPDNRLIYIFLSNRVHPTRANSKLFSLDIRTRIQDVIYKSILKK